jgi:hypothetical protein
VFLMWAAILNPLPSAGSKGGNAPFCVSDHSLVDKSGAPVKAGPLSLLGFYSLTLPDVAAEHAKLSGLAPPGAQTLAELTQPFEVAQIRIEWLKAAGIGRLPRRFCRLRRSTC